MPQKESYITIIKDGSGVGRVRMLPPQPCYIGTMGGIFSKATNNIDFIFHTLSNFDFSTHSLYLLFHLVLCILVEDHSALVPLGFRGVACPQLPF